MIVRALVLYLWARWGTRLPRIFRRVVLGRRCALISLTLCGLVVTKRHASAAMGEHRHPATDLGSHAPSALAAERDGVPGDVNADVVALEYAVGNHHSADLQRATVAEVPDNPRVACPNKDALRRVKLCGALESGRAGAVKLKNRSALKFADSHIWRVLKDKVGFLTFLGGIYLASINNGEFCSVVVVNCKLGRLSGLFGFNDLHQRHILKLDDSGYANEIVGGDLDFGAFGKDQIHTSA